MTTHVRLTASSALLLLLLTFAVIGCRESSDLQLDTTNDAGQSGPPARVITLAPSVTETVYALGLADLVVGVSRFSDYPPEVSQKPTVGGYLDPNLETIVALRPDLVILLVENREIRDTLTRLGIDTLTVDHQTIPGIVESIRTIGQRFDVSDRADRLASDLSERLDAVRARSEGRPPVRVLAAIDREQGIGQIRDLYVAGDSPFFNDAMSICGAENVVRETGVAFPVISTEGLILIDPDVIIDLSVRVDDSQQSNQPGQSDADRDNARRMARDRARADWETLSGQIRAVRSNRIHVIDDDYATVPGPRFILLLEKMSTLFHPER